MARNQERPIPILMVTSGGYQRNNASIIANSISNLKERKLIECTEAESYQGMTESYQGDGDDDVKETSRRRRPVMGCCFARDNRE